MSQYLVKYRGRFTFNLQNAAHYTENGTRNINAAACSDD